MPDEETTEAPETGPCEYCGQPGIWQVDPYQDELYDVQDWMTVCDSCLQDRLDEI